MQAQEERFTIFDIPEVIEGIGLYLDQISLTSCLRVNKTWYHIFLPKLWRDIIVYDFDYTHREFCVMRAGPLDEQDRAPDGKFYEYQDLEAYLQVDTPDFDPFEWPKQLQCRQDSEEAIDGHHHADKFSPWIRSIYAGAIQALESLGPDCVHLKYVVYSSDHESFGVEFDSSAGLWEWVHQRPREIEPRTNSIWLDLIRRNPGLKVLGMSIQVEEEVHLHAQILDALVGLEDLEELSIESQGEGEVVDWVGIVQRRRGRPLKKATWLW